MGCISNLKFEILFETSAGIYFLYIAPSPCDVFRIWNLNFEMLFETCARIYIFQWNLYLHRPPSCDVFRIWNSIRNPQRNIFFHQTLYFTYILNSVSPRFFTSAPFFCPAPLSLYISYTFHKAHCLSQKYSSVPIAGRQRCKKTCTLCHIYMCVEICKCVRSILALHTQPPPLNGERLI